MLFFSCLASERKMVEAGFPVVPAVGLCLEEKENGFSVPGSVSDQAFVTLATNDIYCQGALVLGQSLRNQRATRKLVVLITPQVSSLLR